MYDLDGGWNILILNEWSFACIKGTK